MTITTELGYFLVCTGVSAVGSSSLDGGTSYPDSRGCRCRRR
jgi:hypothetical protein